MVSRQVVSWHLASLFVGDLEVEIDHGHLQPVESARVHLAQGFQRFVVCEQNEVFSYQVGFEMFHSPHCGVHLE